MGSNELEDKRFVAGEDRSIIEKGVEILQVGLDELIDDMPGRGTTGYPGVCGLDAGREGGKNKEEIKGVFSSYHFAFSSSSQKRSISSCGTSNTKL